MDIFIYQAHISIYKADEAKEVDSYDNFWDFRNNPGNLPNIFSGKITFHSPSLDFIKQFIQAIVDQKYPNLEHCIMITDNKKACKKAIKSLFYTLKAGGGLVTKDDQYLLIYRLGKWDLPKGKAEKGEDDETTAIREVEEECSVSVKIQHLIATTWHYYPQKGKQMLKKTYWYAMECIDDSKLQPQTIEDIEKVEWLSQSQLKPALDNSYNSILFVFERYFAQPLQV